MHEEDMDAEVERIIRAARDGWYKLEEAKGTKVDARDYVVAVHPEAARTLRKNVRFYSNPFQATGMISDKATLFGFPLKVHLTIPQREVRLMRREDWRAIEEEHRL